MPAFTKKERSSKTPEQEGRSSSTVTTAAPAPAVQAAAQAVHVAAPAPATEVDLLSDILGGGAPSLPSGGGVPTSAAAGGMDSMLMDLLGGKSHHYNIVVSMISLYSWLVCQIVIFLAFRFC